MKEDKIKDILQRGVEEIVDRKSLEKKLYSGKKLRVKLGIDPTSPNIHIGRSIPLLKLRDFQELGHKVVFIIGDFTSLIGDTSDKESERPMLDKKTVEKNLKKYIKQVEKIIDIEKCETYYNSSWFSKLNYNEIGEHANIFSVNEFISRDNIKKRLEKGKRVSLREVLYPLMQGYDSVKIKADVEIGGTDQRFNLLAGREMQRFYKQEPQDFLTNPLIEGLDGRKMSSSWGNTINILDNPKEMYGKIMSLRDELIIRYFILLTRVEMEEIKKYEKEIKKGDNPKKYKEELAFEIVKFYHTKKSAQVARDYFTKVFSKKETPSKIEEVVINDNKLNILDLLISLSLIKSKGEGKRMIKQKGVKVDNNIVEDSNRVIEIKKGMIVSIGKRKFKKVK